MIRLLSLPAPLPWEDGLQCHPVGHMWTGGPCVAGLCVLQKNKVSSGGGGGGGVVCSL